MTLEDNAQLIARAALERAGERPRFVIALAGPPGVGKSTLSEAMLAAFDACGEAASIVPMDGFHLDNAVLEDRGDLDRKGAPFTFDADGYAMLLKRLRRQADREVAIPVFDRLHDLSRAGGRVIAAGQRFLIAEGNYLLLDRPPWQDMADLFDMTVMLTAPAEVLRSRLIQRWIDHNLAEADAFARAMHNDIPNAELVLHASRPADITLENGD
ncbi:MAG: nucleoside/nucleotide kinase family protein [Hoeflea sp.]|uniref:nucleoside/nucleotide kinase family protein n=1 Tax=Hoeflea sp. TaxID=1940281 RepID=UPI0032EE9A64